MTQIGLDTSVLLGLIDPKDVWHRPAVVLKQALKAHHAEVAVFDCVLAETAPSWGCKPHASSGRRFPPSPRPSPS